VKDSVGMSVEIERKFLLEDRPAQFDSSAAAEIEQGYLAISDEVEVRLRRASGEHMLTVKRGGGEIREEVEIALAPEQFEALWPLTARRRLAKRRHRVPLEDGTCAEVDEYDGELAGLLVAEVEFSDEAASREFRPPSWFGEEVTGDSRYANQSLATEGLAESHKPASRGKRMDMAVASADRTDGGPFRLKRKEGAVAGMRRIALGRAERAAERLREAEGADDLAPCVHGARKDLKKLRAVLRLLRRELGDDLYHEENERYRDAARLLSAPRDAEVKLETLAGLRERFGEGLGLGVDEWSTELQRDRDVAIEAIREGAATSLGRATGMVEQGRERIAAWPLETDSRKLVAPRIERAYRRGRREMRRAKEDPSGPHLHQWRKRAKDLWYQLRILRKSIPASLARSIDLADELADVLGEHHDLAVLRDDLLVRELPAVDRPAVIAAIAERQAELAATAFDLGGRLYSRKPRAFRKRMHRGWKRRR
jgi:adenylate cyclase